MVMIYNLYTEYITSHYKFHSQFYTEKSEGLFKADLDEWAKAGLFMLVRFLNTDAVMLD